MVASAQWSAEFSRGSAELYPCRNLPFLENICDNECKWGIEPRVYVVVYHAWYGCWVHNTSSKKTIELHGCEALELEGVTAGFSVPCANLRDNPLTKRGP